MAENILDYIEAIQEYDSEDVCFTQSDTLWVEGSSNEFRSSNADFMCWSPGDYFIVWGTQYNDGVYEKANGVDAYVLQAKSPFSGETVSLTSENCRGKLVAINEVGAIGKGSMVAERPKSSGFGEPGVAGEGQITASNPTAYAMVGEAIARCEAPPPTANATAIPGEQGDASVTAPVPTTDAYIGNGGTCEAQSPTASATVVEFVGNGEAEAPAPWASATVGEYTDKTIWGRADITAPTPLGVDYADAGITAQSPVIDAVVQAENHGKINVPPPTLRSFSIESVAKVFASNPTVSATGSSGITVKITAPNPTVEAHLGAEGRISVPAPTAKAYSGFPDHYIGEGDAVAPSPEIDAAASVPPKPESGDASVTVPSPTLKADGLRHVIATGNARVVRAIARGAAVTGVTGEGRIRIEEPTASIEAITEAIADGNVVVANAVLSAEARERKQGSLILQYYEHSENFVWET